MKLVWLPGGAVLLQCSQASLSIIQKQQTPVASQEAECLLQPAASSQHRQWHGQRCPQSSLLCSAQPTTILWTRAGLCWGTSVPFTLTQPSPSPDLQLAVLASNEPWRTEQPRGHLGLAGKSASLSSCAKSRFMQQPGRGELCHLLSPPSHLPLS